MIRQYRKQWLRWHRGYERTAAVIFQRTFKDIAKNIPFDRMSIGTYKAYLITYVNKEMIFKKFVIWLIFHDICHLLCIFGIVLSG